MWIGFAEFDYLLGDVHSLKHKRSLVRPVVAELRRRFSVSAAEVGHLDVFLPHCRARLLHLGQWRARLLLVHGVQRRVQAAGVHLAFCA